MKRLLSFIIILSVVLQSAGSLLIFAGYELNKDYISKVLCENKEKPKSCCEGKCFLKKELNDQGEKEQSLPLLKDKQETVQFYESCLSFSFNNIQTKKVSFIYPEQILESGFLSGVFHPPTTAFLV